MLLSVFLAGFLTHDLLQPVFPTMIATGLGHSAANTPKMENIWRMAFVFMIIDLATAFVARKTTVSGPKDATFLNFNVRQSASVMITVTRFMVIVNTFVRIMKRSLRINVLRGIITTFTAIRQMTMILPMILLSSF